MRLKFASRSYCHQYDILQPEGYYKKPPGALFDSLKKFFDANQSPTFEIGSSAELSFLELAKSLDFKPRRILTGVAKPGQLQVFSFYLLPSMEFASGFVDKKFDTEHLLFDSQLDCSRELIPENMAWSWGCGNGKRQIRKICVHSPGKVPKRDIFPPALWPYCNQGILVVTKRLRDSLVAEKLTGFELTPVLDGRKKWTPSELEFSYKDEAQVEQAQWFQLTITAKNLTSVPLTQALKLQGSLGQPWVIAEPCAVCHVNSGYDTSPYRFYEKVHPLERFSSADIQMWDRFQMQDESFLVDSPMSQIIVSGRFMDLFVRNKFKGLLKRSPHPYPPMLIKEEVEEALPADVLAGYPAC